VVEVPLRNTFAVFSMRSAARSDYKDRDSEAKDMSMSYCGFNSEVNDMSMSNCGYDMTCHDTEFNP